MCNQDCRALDALQRLATSTDNAIGRAVARRDATDDKRARWLHQGYVDALELTSSSIRYDLERVGAVVAAESKERAKQCAG